jgi:hypothetical protein
MVGGGGALGFPGGLGRGSAFDPALPMGPGEANPSKAGLGKFVAVHLLVYRPGLGIRPGASHGPR